VVLLLAVPLIGASCSTAPSSSSSDQNQLVISILTLIFCGTTSLPSCIIHSL
jgi:hypothetical protein